MFRRLYSLMGAESTAPLIHNSVRIGSGRSARTWLSLFLILPLIFLFSCLDRSDYEWDEVALNPSIALPLVNGKVSLNDLLENLDSTISTLR